MQAFNKIGIFEDLKHPGQSKYYSRPRSVQQVLNQDKRSVGKELNVCRSNRLYNNLDGFSFQIR